MWRFLCTAILGVTLLCGGAALAQAPTEPAAAPPAQTSSQPAAQPPPPPSSQPTTEPATQPTAQSANVAAADALFTKGREAMARGDYATALSKFAESQRLDPGFGAVVNIAECQSKLGQLIQSLQTWREAIQMLPPGDPRLPQAREQEAAAEKRVPRLTLTLAPNAPPGAKVICDDIEIGSASLGKELPLNPGAHTVVVVARGYQDQRTSVSLAAGEKKPLTIGGSPVPLVVAPLEGPRDVATTSSSRGSSTAMRTAGWIIGGVGVASFIAAGITEGLLASTWNTVTTHCSTDKLCDDEGLNATEKGKSLVPVNSAFWITGFAATSIGGGLLIGSFFEGRKDAPKVAVRGSVLPGSAWASVSGTF